MTDLEKTINDTLTKTVGAIEKIAPEAWKLMVEATRLDAAVNLCAAATWIVALVTFSFWCRWFRTKVEKPWRADFELRNPNRTFEPWDTPLPLLSIARVAALIAVVAIASAHFDEVARLMHPDVYTAKGIVAGVAP